MHLRRWLCVCPLLLTLGCGARVESSPSDAAAAPGCEATTHWFSSSWDLAAPWTAPEGLTAVEGDAFYALDPWYLETRQDILRVDPSGAVTLKATVETQPRRLLPRGGGLWSASWHYAGASNDELRVQSVFGASPVDLHVHTTGAGVLDAAPFDSDAVLVMGWQWGGERAVFALYGLDGTPLGELTAAPKVQHRLHARAEGRPVVSSLENGSLSAGEALLPLDVVSTCTVKSYDLVSLEPGAFAWVAICVDGSVVVQEQSSAAPASKTELALDVEADTVAIGRGPNDTLAVTVSGDGSTFLVTLTRGTLAPVASTRLPDCGLPQCRARELAQASVNGVVAVRVRGEIPDGFASRWVLVRPCSG